MKNRLRSKINKLWIHVVEAKAFLLTIIQKQANSDNYNLDIISDKYIATLQEINTLCHELDMSAKNIADDMNFDSNFNLKNPIKALEGLTGEESMIVLSFYTNLADDISIFMNEYTNNLNKYNRGLVLLDDGIENSINNIDEYFKTIRFKEDGTMIKTTIW